MMPAGSRGFEYRLRYSRRSRRIRISVLPGMVSVASPVGIPAEAVDGFVRSRSSWIEEKLALFQRNPGPSSRFELVRGGDIWLFGEKLKIKPVPGEALPKRSKGDLLVGGELLTQGKLRAALDQVLMEVVRNTSAEASRFTGLVPASIRLGNARTRWGSCSSRGVVMINRKLVHAPAEVVRYVTCHELMHLKHGNHSPLFWRDLHSVVEGVSEARKWLRFQGAHLLC